MQNKVQNNSGPLNGIRVLDLTNVVAGPVATLYLAMMGAEIIKLENPKNGGDVNRRASATDEECNARFCTVNHNKKSVAIDLSTAEGKELFLELVSKSDIVVENFRSGVMDRLGLGYGVLKKHNPRIVYGSISGFGSADSPYCKLAVYDVIAQAISGITMMSGEEGDPPVKVGTSIGDVIAGINLALAVVAALREAERTATAQRVEVALVDAMISSMLMDNITCLNGGVVPRRIGNRYREWSPYGIYRAKDGYYALGVGTEESYSRLVRNVLGHPELMSDPRCASQVLRAENREVTESVLNEWASGLTVGEVCMILDGQNIPNARVNSLKDVTEDPHFCMTRNMFPSFDQPEVGPVRVTNLPIRFFDCDEPQASAAPKMGENTDEVLLELLAMDETKIEALHRNGIIQ